LAAPRSALILGAGLAGLTCARELARAGVAVTVLEKLPVVGGLARNVSFQGARFDLGGHRFFTPKPELVAWLRELVGDDLRQVGRKSRILLNGRYFDYPLRLFNALSGFGLAGSTRIVADYAAARARRALSAGEDVSFEDWVGRRYGRRLYDIYFRPYTEKVWGLSCREISAEWAAQRIQLLSLTDAVVRAMWRRDDGPKTYAQSFWYPNGGIGMISEALAARVRELGGVVRNGCAVQSIAVDRGRVTEVVADGETWRADVVISTIPLTVLGRLVDAPPEALAGLSYRAIRCIYLLLAMPRVTDDTWLYFPEADVVFARSHEPRNWGADLAPPGGTSLCLEIFCNEGDELWRRDEKELAARCIDDLARLGLIAADRVTGVFGEHVPHAYPVFRVGFRQPLQAVLDHVRRCENLHLLGRTGAYLYYNMDQVAEAAMTLARQLVSA